MPQSFPPSGGGQGFVPNPKLRFLDQCREVLRFYHYASRTEEAYCGWIVQFVRWAKEGARLSGSQVIRLSGAGLGSGISDVKGGWRHLREMVAAPVKHQLGSSLFSVEWKQGRAKPVPGRRRSGLKARDVKAWGGASQRAKPQVNRPESVSALKGRNKVSPFQGWIIFRTDNLGLRRSERLQPWLSHRGLSALSPGELPEPV